MFFELGTELNGICYVIECLKEFLKYHSKYKSYQTSPQKCSFPIESIVKPEKHSAVVSLIKKYQTFWYVPHTRRSLVSFRDPKNILIKNQIFHLLSQFGTTLTMALFSRPNTPLSVVVCELFATPRSTASIGFCSF